MHGEMDEDWEGHEAGQESLGPLGEVDPEPEAEVECPYCGEVVEITLDAAGGAVQDYVEDCPVCCRPWQVHVSYGIRGSVELRVEQA